MGVGFLLWEEILEIGFVNRKPGGNGLDLIIPGFKTILNKKNKQRKVTPKMKFENLTRI